ncbi:hypothetical protein DERP_002045 [Dermatophagoides pteronyssinus]|uniref:Uncharacterized protein n=1 Tax=Dermatophagoides pteronyssinus TaxID=6956 RepID=A0ABQ8JH26_DERPT|nr:hypothetical protein DERP_002045 [Dermatophagoides pteronyssinus]
MTEVFYLCKLIEQMTKSTILSKLDHGILAQSLKNENLLKYTPKRMIIQQYFVVAVFMRNDNNT